MEKKKKKKKKKKKIYIYIIIYIYIYIYITGSKNGTTSSLDQVRIPVSQLTSHRRLFFFIMFMKKFEILGV